MKTLLPNTKFYNFSRKFWQVTAYLEISLGAAPSPASPWNRPWSLAITRESMSPRNASKGIFESFPQGLGEKAIISSYTLTKGGS